MQRYVTINNRRIKREVAIEENTKLVHYILKKKFHWTEGFRQRNNRLGTNSFTYNDLLQEGIIGLINAIDTYDENKGSFSNYAGNAIVIAISNELMNKGFGLICMPKSIYLAKKEADELSKKTGKTYRELYEDKKITKNLYMALLIIINNHNPEQILENDESIIFVETPRDSFEKTERKDHIKKMLWISTNIAYKDNVDRNYQMVLMRFGLNGSTQEKTYEQIGLDIKRKFGTPLGKQRVMNIIDKVLVEMKTLVERKQLQ